MEDEKSRQPNLLLTANLFTSLSQWGLLPKFKCESMRYLRRIIIIIIIGFLIITPLFINKQLPWIISQREREGGRGREGDGSVLVSL